MMEGILELDDIEVRSIMTPRTQIVLLDLEAPQEDKWCLMAKSGHSHFPVYQGTRDNVVGIDSVKALWAESSLRAKHVCRTFSRIRFSCREP
jgi:putative hemolysin